MNFDSNITDTPIAAATKSWTSSTTMRRHSPPSPATTICSLSSTTTFLDHPDTFGGRSNTTAMPTTPTTPVTPQFQSPSPLAFPPVVLQAPHPNNTTTTATATASAATKDDDQTDECESSRLQAYRDLAREKATAEHAVIKARKQKVQLQQQQQQHHHQPEMSIAKRSKKQLTKRQLSSKKSAEICRIKTRIYTEMLEKAVHEEESANSELAELVEEQRKRNDLIIQQIQAMSNTNQQQQQQQKQEQQQQQQQVHANHNWASCHQTSTATSSLSSSSTYDELPPDTYATSTAVNSKEERQNQNQMHQGQQQQAMGPSFSSDLGNMNINLDDFMSEANGMGMNMSMPMSIPMPTPMGLQAVKKEEDSKFVSEFLLSEPCDTDADMAFSPMSHVTDCAGLNV